MGFLAAIGGLLGGVSAKTVGGAVLGAGLDVAKNQIVKSRDIRRYQKMGLTATEIAGTGAGSGAAGDGATQVLGNAAGQKEIQQRQQEYEEKQRALDRAVQLSGQQTQLATAETMAQASIASSSISASASRYSTDQQREANRLSHNRDTQRIVNEWANNNPALNLRMKELGMGPDNMQLYLVMTSHGINIDMIEEMSKTPQGRQELKIRIHQALDEFALRSGSPSSILGAGAANLDAIGTPNNIRPGGFKPTPMPSPPTLGNNVPLFNPNP